MTEDNSVYGISLLCIKAKLSVGIKTPMDKGTSVQLYKNPHGHKYQHTNIPIGIPDK